MPKSAVIAKATPKNVLQIDMTSGRQRAGLICAMSVGAATTIMRCDSPSASRVTSINPKSGNAACTNDNAAPNSRAGNSRVRNPKRAISNPANRPHKMPTMLRAETRNPISAPWVGYSARTCAKTVPILANCAAAPSPASHSRTSSSTARGVRLSGSEDGLAIARPCQPVPKPASGRVSRQSPGHILRREPYG